MHFKGFIIGITEALALAADNHELTQELTGIQQSMQTNLGRITDLETQVGNSDSKLNEAILSRDKVRNLVKDELGIDEFTVDAVRGKLSSYASADAQDSYGKQIKDLKANSAITIEELQGKLNAKDADIQNLMMKVAISGTDVMGQTQGQYASEMVMGWIAEDATFNEDGTIAYKGKSGETLYNSNGDPLTLDDRINQIKADEARSFAFQSRFLSGGGAPTEKVITGPAGDQSGGAYVRSKMSFDEKKSYRSKFGEAAYLKLPLA